MCTLKLRPLIVAACRDASVIREIFDTNSENSKLQYVQNDGRQLFYPSVALFIYGFSQLIRNRYYNIGY
jgi:hypothetical protein